MLYLIDYGLAKKYRDPTTSMHIPYRDNKRLTGTARYASLATHMGIEQARRDDLECLGYSFVYLLNGELPWQGTRAENKREKYHIIKEKKITIKPDQLCKDLPAQLVRYFNYCRILKFEEKPDYAYLKKIFKDLFYEKQYDSNFEYDWVHRRVSMNFMRMDTWSVDETNIADCPGRRCTKIVNENNELRVTELSAPLTVYSANPFASCRSVSQPMTTTNRDSRRLNKSTKLDNEDTVEEVKGETSKFVNQYKIEAKMLKNWGCSKKAETLNLASSNFHYKETNSCDFKETDINENTSANGKKGSALIPNRRGNSQRKADAAYD